MDAKILAQLVALVPDRRAEHAAVAADLVAKTTSIKQDLIDELDKLKSTPDVLAYVSAVRAQDIPSEQAIAEDGHAHDVFNSLRGPQPSLLEQAGISDCTIDDVRESLGYSRQDGP